MKPVFFLLNLLCLFCIHDSCAYIKEAKILAIVDNEIISNIDLEKRMLLIKQIPGLAPSDGESNILQYLIDEHLFFKYAKDFNVAVSDVEVEGAIKSLGMQLSDSDYKELFTQVKAKLIWNKMVANYILPITNVSDDEIENYINSIADNKNSVKLVKFIGNIEDKPDPVDVGWVSIKDLDGKVTAAIAGLELGQIGKSVDLNGQATKFKIVDVENEHILKAYFKVKKLEKDVQFYKDEYCKSDVMQLKGSELSTELRSNLLSIKEHQVSNIIKDKLSGDFSGYRVVLCGSSLKRDVHQHIFVSKIDEEQKKYLEKLRENSFIEIKA